MAPPILRDEAIRHARAPASGRRSRLPTAVAAALLVWTTAAAAPPQMRAAVPAAEAPEAIEFDVHVRPLLSRYCFGCHGPEKKKGGLRLDVLDPDLVGGGDAEDWRTARLMLERGKMPPPDERQMSEEERGLALAWLTRSLDRAALAQQGARRPVLRRLTRQQYTHTLQDLLGLDVDFGRALPPDARSEMGFTNDGEVLQSSPLHLEYYQAIARSALDRAIAPAERPAVTRYRVRFGRGIGRGRVAGETGGYQSVPLSSDDFVVEVLDAQGRPRVGEDAAERDALDATRRRISVGLRGSSHDRFRVVDEGVILYSALPHKEKVPKAWQGPSPNLKLEMQRVFPDAGDFAMRVRASRGYRPPLQRQVLVGLEDPEPRAALSERGGAVRASEDALVLRAADAVERANLRMDGDALRPVDVPEPSTAVLAVELPEDGVYQIDLVHPAASPDAMASVRLTVAGLSLDLRPEVTDAQRERGRGVTTLGAANLRRGANRFVLGGPFFIGFSHLVVTPLPADHPLVVRLTTEADAAERAATRALTPALRVYAGTRTDDGMDYQTFDAPQEVEAPLGEARTYTFRGRLEDLPLPEPESGDTEILSGFTLLGLWNDHLVKSAAESGPPLLVESIEVEAPYLPEWPPASHRAIFFDSSERDDLPAYTRDVVSRFAERAFRRPLTTAELDRYMAFWQEVRGDHARYESGVREVLVAVLCSPHFLFLSEPPGDEETEWALASRLSYFLWDSPPDAELRALARRGRLRDGLAEEVERLLDDPRAVRFVRAFAGAWLRLDRLRGISIDADAHPTFTRFVKRDMEEETVRFVHDVLRRDLDVFTLIDSDFALLNQNLAEFYGIEGVRGGHFRPVPLSRDMRRGGLLSQGAFLAGHSDGVQPHPVKRAVWVKARILGDPPPDPPPNVPDLDPETPGFERLTLKEQLEVHRDKDSCRSCHAGFDPYGVVFERYNAVGLHESERLGRPIDARAKLPGGPEVDGVDALKDHIRFAQPDAFARSLIRYLYAYALGRSVGFADEPVLDRILDQVRSSGYRMRSLIHAIVASPSFAGPDPNGSGDEPQVVASQP